jgi:hypothetical protein
MLKRCSGMLTLGLNLLTYSLGYSSNFSGLETEMETAIRLFLCEIVCYVSLKLMSRESGNMCQRTPFSQNNYRRYI